MGLLDWLTKRNRGDTTAVLTFNKDEEELAGLNLKQVLDAHMAWRVRLEAVLNGTSKERLEVAQISPDNLCVLGKWLYGPGKVSLGTTPQYEVLRNTHLTFHQMAGKILADFNRGDKSGAERLLNRDFRRLSDRIQLELVRLYAAKK
jgi:Chemoreceptor zinc-binding domain